MTLLNAKASPLAAKGIVLGVPSALIPSPASPRCCGIAACASASPVAILGAMPGSLRILITNNTLAKPAGTELSVFDYASSLARRGHLVAAFSAHLGEIASRLREQGVGVVENLETLPWMPDVIHGHHSWETTIAALRFFDAPVISFCRGPENWPEVPCLAPNVVRWVAVDEACRDRLLKTPGVQPDRVEMVLNGVDLVRFKLRETPVTTVKRVLILSNYASEQNYVPAVRAACEHAGAELVVIGSAAGNVHPTPHEILESYDVVFAKGKAALEALATGCAVVVCDTAGLGPLVTTQNLEAMRRLSFGNPCMTDSIDPARVMARLSEVDAAEVARVAEVVRETCGLERTIDQLEDLYARTVADGGGARADAERIARFAARFLAECTHAWKLGRKTQEFWHDLREPECPDQLDAVKVDRILDAFFNSEAKLAKVRARLQKAQDKIEELCRRHGKPKRGVAARLREVLAWPRPRRDRGKG